MLTVSLGFLMPLLTLLPHKWKPATALVLVAVALTTVVVVVFVISRRLSRGHSTHSRVWMRWGSGPAGSQAGLGLSPASARSSVSVRVT